MYLLPPTYFHFFSCVASFYIYLHPFIYPKWVTSVDHFRSIFHQIAKDTGLSDFVINLTNYLNQFAYNF